MRGTTAVLLIGATLIAGAAPAVAGGGHVLAPVKYRPTHSWCPTNRTCFSHVTWTTYTSSRAAGYGAAKSCAGGGGPCQTYRRLAVTLTAPANVCGRQRFTHLRMFGNRFALVPPLCSTYEGPLHP